MATFKLQHDSLQDRFLQSKSKVQLFGGGFANGKTSAECIKCIKLAKDYPGSNILMARSTYPKLNDTLRKEFLKWLPADWIDSFPKSANASNTCTLKNGTTINFRYIAQQGKLGNEATTSNLLSATYDAIFVDQIEDPEIVHKDFLDLLGRLRGMTPYVGDDPDMPNTGPRWFIVSTNPTRNWVYRKLVRPIHDLLPYDPETGKPKKPAINEDLLCETDEDGRMLFDENNLPVPIIEVFEGSTYENRDNLEPDFIKTLEASYKGQMRSRFLMGKWASYEGLVYPAFEESIHVMSHFSIENYFDQLRMKTEELTILEGYDYGLAVPYCYILGFCDNYGNVFLMDGAYEKEQPLEEHTNAIKEIRGKYNIPHNLIFADPDIFRRKTVGKKLIGKSISDMMLEEGIICTRGNNDISNGIVKVSQYLIPQVNHQNPITGEYGMPYMYVSDKLDWFINEINDYYWMKNPMGEQMDKPIDKNDHAMDTIKYMLSNRPNVSKLVFTRESKKVGWYKWGERDVQEARRNIRHAQ
jgi:phage terminase large subunit